MRSKDTSQLVYALGPEPREERVERRSYTEVRELAKEFGAVVFFLNRICLLKSRLLINPSHEALSIPYPNHL